MHLASLDPSSETDWFFWNNYWKIGEAVEDITFKKISKKLKLRQNHLFKLKS